MKMSGIFVGLLFLSATSFCFGQYYSTPAPSSYFGNTSSTETSTPTVASSAAELNPNPVMTDYDKLKGDIDSNSKLTEEEKEEMRAKLTQYSHISQQMTSNLNDTENNAAGGYSGSSVSPQ